MAEMEIVLGPPGTGKTTTLIGFVEQELAAGTPPDRIAYLSFTRRAAEEAATRACAKFGRELREFPYFRTLHSLCFRFLGLTSSDVLEGKRLKEFAEFAGIRVTGRWSEDGTMTGFDVGDRILFMENLSRVRGVTLAQQYALDDDELSWNQVEKVARELRLWKESRGLLDYTDMLVHFARSDVRLPIEVLVVDEGQDLSWAQWQVVHELARTCRRFVVAGDDDQAIYRWAGADVDYFIAMQGQVRVLDQSYRVPQAVQEVSDRAIAVMRRRRAKDWHPRAEEGVVDRCSAFHDADVTAQDVLVLARNDYVLREQVEPELRRDGIIYEKRGFPSIRTAYIDAIGWWEQLRRGQSITGAQARMVYDLMSSGTHITRGQKKLPKVGDEDVLDLRYLQAEGGLLRTVGDMWWVALDRVPLADKDYIRAALRRGEKVRAKPRIRVSTIHGAKGGEADHVVLMTEIAQRTHLEMIDNPEDEARVWYVGATRARQRLTIVDAKTGRRCPWL
jgi:DNA helicase-2/ATP-dependent DNA helicase PcrA